MAASAATAAGARALTVPFISLDTLRGYLPVREGVTAYDGRMRDCILVASQQIEIYVRRRFERKNLLEYHNSSDRSRLVYDFGGYSDTGLSLATEEQIIRLNRFPVDTAQPFEIRYDPSRVFSDASVIPPERYTLEPENGRVLLNAATMSGRNRIRVTYTGGFAESGSPATLDASLPPDLKMACALQAMSLWNRSQPATVGVTSDRKEGVGKSAQFSSLGGLTPEVMALVSPYRNILVGRL